MAQMTREQEAALYENTRLLFSEMFVAEQRGITYAQRELFVQRLRAIEDRMREDGRFG